MEQKGINIENPKTKTDFEVRDMEWKNLIGLSILFIVLLKLAGKYGNK